MLLKTGLSRRNLCTQGPFGLQQGAPVMRLESPNTKQTAYDKQRTLNDPPSTKPGIFIVFGAVALSLLVWYLAYLPAGAPNSGSTSTLAEVGPAGTVGARAARKPGLDPDGR